VGYHPAIMSKPDNITIGIIGGSGLGEKLGLTVDHRRDECLAGCAGRKLG
jgi:purine nucleoside phosphorylase